MPVRSSSLVELLTIELPTARVALGEPREPLELGRVRIRISLSCELFQVFADKLIDACTERIGAAARAPDYFIIDRERDIHSTIIRAHLISVKCRPRFQHGNSFIYSSLLRSSRSRDANCANVTMCP